MVDDGLGIHLTNNSLNMEIPYDQSYDYKQSTARTRAHLHCKLELQTHGEVDQTQLEAHMPKMVARRCPPGAVALGVRQHPSHLISGRASIRRCTQWWEGRFGRDP